MPDFTVVWAYELQFLGVCAMPSGHGRLMEVKISVQHFLEIFDIQAFIHFTTFWINSLLVLEGFRQWFYKHWSYWLHQIVVWIGHRHFYQSCEFTDFCQNLCIENKAQTVKMDWWRQLAFVISMLVCLQRTHGEYCIYRITTDTTDNIGERLQFYLLIA